MRALAFAGAAPHDADGNGDPDTYRTGDAIRVAATFSEAVTVDETNGRPWLALQVGSSTRKAYYASGSGTAVLVFAYAVATGETDADGVSVPAGSIELDGSTLKDGAGNAATLVHRAIAPDPARKVDGSTTPARLTGLAFTGTAPRDADRDGVADTYRAGDAIALEATFDRAVAVDTAGGRPTLALTVGSDERQAAYVSGTGTAVLAFSYTVASEDNDGDGVSVPAGSIDLDGGRIGDAAGTATLVHDAVAADEARKVDTAAPRITGAVGAGTQLAPLGEGATARLAVDFSEPVFVSGAPVLRIGILGGSSQDVAYAGKSGDSRLLFDFEVEAGDGNRTISSAHDPAVRGGTVVDGAGNAAGRSLPAGTSVPVHVDGSQAGADTVAPVVMAVAFAGAAPHDADGDATPETYRRGDAVQVAVSFSEAVTVDTKDGAGIPSLGLLVGTNTREAAYASGTGTATLVFSYAVAADDTDGDGVSVAAGSIALNNGTLRDAGNNAAVLGHGALAPDARRRVDGTIVPAKLTGLAFAGAAPRDADRDGVPDTYRPGDTISVEATFERAVAVTGAPTLALTVGENTREAAYVRGTSTATLTFSYTVATGDEDSDGVSLPANPIALGGGRIRATAGTAVLTHGGVAADALHKVDGVAPSMTGASRNEGSLSGGHFGRGETLRLAVHFTEPVFAVGSPTLRLATTVAPHERTASYAGRDDGPPAALWFDYVVQAADVSRGGIPWSATTEPLAGTVVDAAGNAFDPVFDSSNNALFDLNGAVAGADTVAPVVQEIAFAGAAPRDSDGDDTPDTYGAGHVIEVAVAFSEAVTVTTGNGTPSLGLRVGSNTRQASYASGSGTAALTFSYTVAADDADTDGVSVPANGIAPRGGTIADAAGNAAALDHDAVAADPDRKVDGTFRPTRVTALAFAGTAPRDADRDGAGDTWRLGDTIEVRAAFDKAVTVDTTNGTPWLALTVGANTRQAEYESGTGTAALTFSYTVAADDEDTDGVSVAAGSIALEGGTLRDAAGDGAALGHDAIARDAKRKVDGVGPSEPTVTVNAGGGTDAGWFYRGETLRFTVTFSEPVYVSGTPKKPLAIGTGARQNRWWADYAGRKGPSVLLFDYVAHAGDSGGLTYEPDQLNGGIVDAAGNAYVDAFRQARSPGIQFDGSRTGAGDTLGPAVQALAFAGAALHDADGNGDPDTYRTGDAIRVAATFAEAVTVDTTRGTPWLWLRVGTNTRKAYYASGSGTAALVFAYAVAMGERRRRRGVGAGGLDRAQRGRARGRGGQRRGAGPRRDRAGSGAEGGRVDDAAVAYRAWLRGQGAARHGPRRGGGHLADGGCDRGRGDLRPRGVGDWRAVARAQGGGEHAPGGLRQGRGHGDAGLLVHGRRGRCGYGRGVGAGEPGGAERRVDRRRGGHGGADPRRRSGRRGAQGGRGGAEAHGQGGVELLGGRHRAAGRRAAVHGGFLGARVRERVAEAGAEAAQRQKYRWAAPGGLRGPPGRGHAAVRLHRGGGGQGYRQR